MFCTPHPTTTTMVCAIYNFCLFALALNATKTVD